MTRLFDLTPPQPSAEQLTCPACGVTERNELLFRNNHGFPFDQPELMPRYWNTPGLCVRLRALWVQEGIGKQKEAGTWKENWT